MKPVQPAPIPWMQLIGKTFGFIFVLMVLFLICRNDSNLEPKKPENQLISQSDNQDFITLAQNPSTTTDSIDTLIRRLKQMQNPIFNQNHIEETTGLNLILDKDPFTDPSPVLAWTGDPHASQYTVIVDDSEQCTSPLYTTTVPINRIKIPIFLENGTYWVCLSAVSLKGETIDYTESQFVVEAEGVGATADFQGHQSSPHYGYYESPFPSPDHENIQEILAPPHDFYGRKSMSEHPTPSQKHVGLLRHFSLVSDPNDEWKVKLLVVDQRWNRVLIFSTFPEDQDTLPDLVIGDKAYREPPAFQPIVTGPLTLNRPSHLSVCTDGRLLVTDTGNHRVLVWQHIPQDFMVPPDFVIGQETFESSDSGVGPSTLNQPAAAFCTHRGILIADAGNNRLLVFSPHDLKKARLVIGQDNFYKKSARCSQTSVGQVEDLWIDGERLIIADTNHHRILMYSTFPKENGTGAQKVLGQSSFDQCQPNRGLSAEFLSNDTLHEPSGLAIRNGVLAVSDRRNKRILLFNWDHSFPREAFDVLGQRDFGRPPEANFGPGTFPMHGVAFTKNGLWTIDQQLGRLVKLTLPQDWPKTRLP